MGNVDPIRNAARAGFLVALCVLGAAACSGGREPVTSRAAVEGADWPMVGRTHQEQNYSPLEQINASNVSRLGLAWYADLDTNRGVEAAPLFVDGVLYNTSAWNVTAAYDARTGKRLWRYDPQVPPQFARLACCDVVSRGLALSQGKVIIATLDGRLIALDAKTGTPVWQDQTLDVPGPYSVTGAPRVFGEKVVIGNAGADFGARGYVTAYDVATGKRVWRFYTVPGDPSKPRENAAMEKAAQTWQGDAWKGGGGTVWDGIVYDEELKLLYLGVGNAGPLKFNAPGDNLFTASIVALKADTGEYVWHYQTVQNDIWDFTATQPMILADLALNGAPRKVIMQAPKNGFFYVLDRATGELLSAEKFAPNTWATHVDLATGRAVLTPQARYEDNEPTLLTPGPAGAHNWFPMSYSPKTGLVYFPVQEGWMVYPLGPGRAEGNVPDEKRADRLKKRRELSALGDSREKGWLTAWDPVAQKEVWRVPHSRPGSGGVLSTAGNLVVQGSPDRKLVIYSADKGERLWEMFVQQAPIANAITYLLDGKQYIAVNAGWGGGMALVEMAANKPPLHVSTARLLVFKLDGKAVLPELAPPSKIPPPPLARAPEELVNLGHAVYDRVCARCHGQNVRGGLKDLRYMTRETYAQFSDIVLKGTRKDKGMASFADVVTPRDVAAVRAYIVARANEDYLSDGGMPETPPVTAAPGAAPGAAP
ncbi:MAG: PQQ-dependent dehydrogenase, methanol/ethanol family [Gammaproteobacteria bacterium]|nr:PQQ-dependent dehydrogenase, methanol/ethanol family [Gammaproteobacteria bacterium]